MSRKPGRKLIAQSAWPASVSITIACLSSCRTVAISAGVSANLSQASAKAKEHSAARRISGLFMLPSAAAWRPGQAAAAFLFRAAGTTSAQRPQPKIAPPITLPNDPVTMLVLAAAAETGAPHRPS
jgi:hypothetical protein